MAIPCDVCCHMVSFSIAGNIVPGGINVFDLLHISLLTVGMFYLL